MKVATADICPVPTADICPVTAAQQTSLPVPSCLNHRHLPCRNTMQTSVQSQHNRHLSCFDIRHLSCLKGKHLSCLNRRHLSNCPEQLCLLSEDLHLCRRAVVSIFEILFFHQGKHCLLYTSPSPRDRQKSRMPSSA